MNPIKKEGSVHLTVVDQNNNCKESVIVNLESPRILHDFLLTKNYCIIPDMPLEFKPMITSGLNLSNFRLNQTKPAL